LGKLAGCVVASGSGVSVVVLHGLGVAVGLVATLNGCDWVVPDWGAVAVMWWVPVGVVWVMVQV
jgi:hypothetical protein